MVLLAPPADPRRPAAPSRELPPATACASSTESTSRNRQCLGGSSSSSGKSTALLSASSGSRSSASGRRAAAMSGSVRTLSAYPSAAAPKALGRCGEEGEVASGAASEQRASNCATSCRTKFAGASVASSPAWQKWKASSRRRSARCWRPCGPERGHTSSRHSAVLPVPGPPTTTVPHALLPPARCSSECASLANAHSRQKKRLPLPGSMSKVSRRTPRNYLGTLLVTAAPLPSTTASAASSLSMAPTAVIAPRVPLLSNSLQHVVQPENQISGRR